MLQKRPRDFCWAKEGDVLPLVERFEQLQVSFTARALNHSVMYSIQFS